MKAIRLPHKSNHPAVGDNLTRYYHYPLIKYFFIKRLVMALEFLNNKEIDYLLEIGCGSGVFLPELSWVSRNLFALDIHDRLHKVRDMARLENIKVAVSKADLLDLPYKDESFDCIIGLSTLEHIQDLRRAISEVKRTLKKGGVAIFGFPVANKLSNFLLILAGSLKAYQKMLSEIHPSTYRDILFETKRQFGDAQVRKFPFFVPLDLALYCSCLCKKD